MGWMNDNGWGSSRPGRRPVFNGFFPVTLFGPDAGLVGGLPDCNPFFAVGTGISFSIGRVFSLFSGEWLRGDGGREEADGVFDLGWNLR